MPSVRLSGVRPGPMIAGSASSGLQFALSSPRAGAFRTASRDSASVSVSPTLKVRWRVASPVTAFSVRPALSREYSQVGTGRGYWPSYDFAPQAIG